MSIESLLSSVYSEMSDVWSFGVLLWELFSYGIQPYYGYTNPEVIEMIRDRKLLTCPLNCPKKVYTLVCSCWEEIVELLTRLKLFQEKSTTLSSVNDELILGNPVESPTANYRTLMSCSGRIPTSSIFIDRNSGSFGL